MSYEVHITRKKFWADEEGPAITPEEWLAYIETDPQLRLVPKSANHKVILSIKSPLRDPWLEWHEGEIRSTGPDEVLRLAARHYRRAGDEGRTLLQAALASAADLQVSHAELRVTLAAQSSPHRTRAIAALCEELNQTKTVFPGSQLHLHYAIREAS